MQYIAETVTQLAQNTSGISTLQVKTKDGAYTDGEQTPKTFCGAVRDLSTMLHQQRQDHQERIKATTLMSASPWI